MKAISRSAWAPASQRRAPGQARDDEGFTLIELLVVLLIIGILLAIAIPVFLSVTKSANNTTAQSNLQTALTGSKTYYTDEGQTFSGVMTPSAGTSSIQSIDTGLSYVSNATASTGARLISVFVGNSGSYLILTAFAKGTNECWGVIEIDSQQTTAVQHQTAVGELFFVMRSPVTSCAASTYGAGGTSASASSPLGFPPA